MRDPVRALKLHEDDWRQGEALRVTPHRRFSADRDAKRMVIRRRDLGEFALTPMRWGLVPEVAPEGEPARPLISVRAETLSGEIEWRRLLNTRRCIVPTDQFFEWKRAADGVKTKEYVFKLRSRRPMMIAALWNRSPGDSGRVVDSFAYITCGANRTVSLVHDRMPVILNDAAVATWMNPDATLEQLLTLLRPMESMNLEVHAVAAQAPSLRPYQPSLFASRAA